MRRSCFSAHLLLLIWLATISVDNVECQRYTGDESGDSGEALVQAYDPAPNEWRQQQAPARNRYPIPVFRMDTATHSECASVVTAHCFVMDYRLCTMGMMRVGCTVAATNSEVRTFFDNIKRLDKDMPILVVLSGPRLYTPRMFEPLRRNILLLDILHYDGINTRAIKDINVPNVVQLFFTRSDHVIINKGDLTSFSHLREISFWNSSASSIEEGSFNNLDDLKLVSLDGKMVPPLRPQQREHLRRFHCNPEYRWLREFFAAHPVLLHPKEPGDLYNLQDRIVNTRRNISDIFIPVDCAKADMAGRQTQSLYSVNVHLDPVTGRNRTINHGTPTGGRLPLVFLLVLTSALVASK